MLWLDDLHVERGAFRLGPLSLVVPAGEVLAVVGANGSGKTTLLSALLGQVAIEAGAAGFGEEVVDPRDRRHLRHFGYVPDEEATVHPEMTAEEYWRLVARVRDAGREDESLRRAHELARRLDHAPGSRLFGASSHGMRKKTQLVAALMHRPRLLLVDELRNGLDPMSIHVAESLVDEAVAEGAVVVAATHDLFWAERRAHQVAILHSGHLAASGSTSSVRGPSASLEARYRELVA